jgi:magnesium transporter
MRSPPGPRTLLEDRPGSRLAAIEPVGPPDEGRRRFDDRVVAVKTASVPGARSTRRANGAKPSRNKRQPATVRAVVFDADQRDREVDLSADAIGAVGDRQLLWADVNDDPAQPQVAELLSMLPADNAAVARFLGAGGPPRLELHGDFFELKVAAPGEGANADPVALALIAGRNYVVTIHEQGLPFLDEFTARLDEDTSLGLIDSAAFSAVLLDGLLTAYLRVADDLEAAVDALDGEALRPTSTRDLLGEMVALRHRIATARRQLASHREVFAALARPDFEIVAGTESTERFQVLAARYAYALEAIEDSREALVGTFDIHTSRTAQRTNNIVKVLTVVSVLLLPTTVIAGFMGMNIKAPYSNDDPTIFWDVLAAIVVIAIGTLITLRARKWL